MMYNKFGSFFFCLILVTLVYLFPCLKLHAYCTYPLVISKCITPQDELITAPNPPLYHYFNIERTGDPIQCVVIDPGHGGKDGGCHGHSINEKDISLVIAKKFKSLLNKRHPGLKVILTRDRDVFIPLHKRAKIANDHHADLFISIHCNSAPKNPSARGTETFVLGLHRAEDNLNVAKRENESILLEENYQRFYGGFDPNAPSTHILMSMFQNAYLDQSIVYADMIERQTEHDYRRRTRGVKQAGFAVLRLTTMPSVLFETGFLSNKEDASYLNSSKGQDELADQLFKAYQSYKKDLEGDYVNPTPIQITNNIDVRKEEKVDAEKPIAANYYSVQLASTSSALNQRPKNWLSLQEIYSIKMDTGYKYFLGKFTDKAHAKARMKDLKKTGIQDAFVVNHPNEAEIAFR